jgi:hypothetical protein
MTQRRSSGRWGGPVAFGAAAVLFAVLAGVVLAASTAAGPGANARIRAPSLVLVTGVVSLVVLAVGIVVLASLLRTLQRGELRDRHQTVRDLIRLFVIFVLLVALFRVLPIGRYRAGNREGDGAAQTAEGLLPQASGTDWSTLVLVACIAAFLGWRMWRTRRAAAADLTVHEPVAGAVADVLDDVIDALRREPDPRRAVIAAYARMEDVFARHGTPRRPSEAPLEFLGRALSEITEADAARRLTDLFESAMFSTQTFDRARQDDAVDALVTVRDDLRWRADMSRRGTAEPTATR